MIIGLIIILLLVGGGDGIDFSDPAFIASLEKDARIVIRNPTRAGNVLAAAAALERDSQAGRAEASNFLNQTIALSGNYNTSLETMLARNRQFDQIMMARASQILDSRDQIRANTTRKEWKALLKSFEKRKKAQEKQT